MQDSLEAAQSADEVVAFARESELFLSTEDLKEAQSGCSSQDASAQHGYNCITDLIPMSEEQFKAFLEEVKANLSLREKLKAAQSTDEVVSAAKEYGYDFSAEEFTACAKRFGQISEDELDNAVGGQASIACATNCVACNTYNTLYTLDLMCCGL
ncbi:Nif11-like leader peptide family natural product precursor [Synechococcus sp. BIOS-E4-1]|uniref:Nif11-like leader peptide family natural product precursor n=1 Tax=Synechococcus sp. BIOS-E4-1 TaxID=1400864 RepID=UPI00351C056D